MSQRKKPSEEGKKLSLPTGWYRLPCAVENPKPGRRKTYPSWVDDRVWPEGMQFVIIDDALPTPPDLPTVQVLQLTTPQMFYRISLGSVQAQALLAHLVERLDKEKPSEWLNRVATGANVAPDIIDVLVERGKVQMADVEAIYNECFPKRKQAGVNG